MAGFEVIIYGRIWVITEGTRPPFAIGVMSYFLQTPIILA